MIFNRVSDCNPLSGFPTHKPPLLYEEGVRGWWSYISGPLSS